MASIIKLQARFTKDEVKRQTLMSVLNRIEALSTVQRKLFTLDDIARFDVADFIRELVTDLVGGVGRNDIRLTLDLSPLLVPAVKATPLSLIVNELVGDAVNRGLSDGGGAIHVDVKRMQGHFVIRVEDTRLLSSRTRKPPSLDGFFWKHRPGNLQPASNARLRAAGQWLRSHCWSTNIRRAGIECHDRRGRSAARHGARKRGRSGRT
nr:sensor histidine kinase [Rhizobium laguerreae]